MALMNLALMKPVMPHRPGRLGLLVGEAHVALFHKHGVTQLTCVPTV